MHLAARRRSAARSDSATRARRPLRMPLWRMCTASPARIRSICGHIGASVSGVAISRACLPSSSCNGLPSHSSSARFAYVTIMFAIEVGDRRRHGVERELEEIARLAQLALGDDQVGDVLDVPCRRTVLPPRRSALMMQSHPQLAAARAASCARADPRRRRCRIASLGGAAQLRPGLRDGAARAGAAALIGWPNGRS